MKNVSRRTLALWVGGAIALCLIVPAWAAITGTGPLAVTGTFWQTTQPVSGTVTTAPPSNASTNIAQIGATAVVADPCQAIVKSYVNISQTASAQIIAGVSAKKTYLCSFAWNGADAENIALVEGTGTVCATGIHGVIGGTTAATGMGFAANGGVSGGTGVSAVMSAYNTAADNVCLLQSGSGQVSGYIAYVQQ